MFFKTDVARYFIVPAFKPESKLEFCLCVLGKIQTRLKKMFRMCEGVFTGGELVKNLGRQLA
jgi:hypothetical protein